MPNHRYLTLPMLTLLLLTSACGPPLLETSSREELESSLLEMKEDLDPPTTRNLESAIGYLTEGAEFGEDEATWGAVLQTYSSLDGMSAAQIIVTAFNSEVWSLQEEIRELEGLLAAHGQSQDLLARLVFDRIRVYKPTPGFLEQPVVEVVVSNETGRSVTGMQLRASLIKADGPQLVVDERIDRPVFAFEHGSRMELRIECQDPSWRSMLATCNDCSFNVEVAALRGRGNVLVASTDFGKYEETRLAALRGRLEEMQASGPPLGCLGESRG